MRQGLQILSAYVDKIEGKKIIHMDGDGVIYEPVLRTEDGWATETQYVHFFYTPTEL